MGKLIGQGWSAVLLEPQPSAVAKLQSRYGLNAAVRIVPAAVCLNAMASSTTLWSLNLTKNVGSNESDPRCLGNLQTEIASLSRSHLLDHQRMYPFTPSQCKKCAPADMPEPCDHR